MTQTVKYCWLTNDMHTITNIVTRSKRWNSTAKTVSVTVERVLPASVQLALSLPRRPITLLCSGPSVWWNIPTEVRYKLAQLVLNVSPCIFVSQYNIRHWTSDSCRNLQYRRQSLASRVGERVFLGHIASDSLRKTLATTPPRGGGNFFLWRGKPSCTPLRWRRHWTVDTIISKLQVITNQCHRRHAHTALIC